MSITKNKGMSTLRGVYTLNIDDIDNKGGNRSNRPSQRVHGTNIHDKTHHN